jgi:hypothetical protein
MCYEESFLRRWAKRRAQQREEPKPVVERATPAMPAGKPDVIPAEGRKRKEVERELEIV